MKSPRIALIDSGIVPGAYGVNNFEDGISFFMAADGTVEVGGDWKTDLIGHGSFMAGIIRQTCPDCSIVPIKIVNDESVSYENLLIYAIEWAIMGEVDIICLCMGLIRQASPELHTACTLAQEKGILVVAAKDNRDLITYPAAFSEVIGVVGDPDLDYGDFVRLVDEPGACDVMARGFFVIQVDPSKTRCSSAFGNSCACAYVAAQCAALLVSDPSMSGKQLKQAFYRLCHTRLHVKPRLPGTVLSKQFIGRTYLHGDQDVITELMSNKDLLICEVVEDQRSADSLTYINSTKDDIDSLVVAYEKGYRLVLLSPSRAVTREFQGKPNVWIEVPISAEPAKRHPVDTTARLRVPTIGIVGTGLRRNKTATMLDVVRDMRKREYNVALLGPEPYLPLLGGKALDYKAALGAPVEVASNWSLAAARLVDETEADLLLFSAPSGLIKFSQRSHNFYGINSLVAFQAFRPDAALLVCNPSDSPEFVRHNIEWVEKQIELELLGIIMDNEPILVSTLADGEAVLKNADHVDNARIQEVYGNFHYPIINRKSVADIINLIEQRFSEEPVVDSGIKQM